MIVDNLIEVLKRNNLSKEVKMLAVQRYLDATSTDKADKANNNE